MSCIFKIRLKQPAAELYQIALQQIEGFGARYSGDETGGDFILDFMGMRFKGSVQVSGGYIVVCVTDKPLLIPCSVIESSIKSYVEVLL